MWFLVDVRSDGLRPPSLPSPLQKYRRMNFIIVWIKFQQTPPTPTPTPQNSPTWPRQLPLDLPLGLGKCHEKFGDASYYRGRMHIEQTDRQTFFFIYIDLNSIISKRRIFFYIEMFFLFIFFSPYSMFTERKKRVEKRQSLAKCTMGGALMKILQGKKPKCSFRNQ